MKKKSLLVLTALAFSAFFAHWPNALRLIREDLRETSDAAGQKGYGAIAPTEAGLKAANELEFVKHGSDAQANSDRDDDAFAQEADPMAESARIDRAVAEIPDGELRQALERSLHDHSAVPYRELLQRRWAEINPSAAATWAASLQDSAKAIPLVQQSAIVWANRDMSAAVQWAESLPEGEIRTTAALAIGYEAARAVSPDGLNLVAGLDPSVERDALLEQSVREWSAADPNQAMEWVNQIPNSALREQLLGDLAVSAAKQNPADAAALVASGLTPGPNQNRAAVAIVQRWAQTDPESAAAWVQQFPESDVKTAAEAALSAAEVQ